MPDIDLDAARTRLAAPDVSGQELADIAAQHPSLRVLVAAHPGTYPALTSWLGNLGDPTIDAVIAARTSTGYVPPPPPAPAPGPWAGSPALPARVYGPTGAHPAAPTDGLSVAALVTGVLGMSVVPLALGILGLRRTHQNGTRGRGMAITGIVLGAGEIGLAVLLVLSALLSWGWLTTKTTTVLPAQGAATTSYTLTTTGKLPADEMNATADLLRARLASTPATVAVKGQAIRVTFDSPPDQAILTAMTASAVVAFRPVLVTSDAPTTPQVTPTRPASGPSSPSDVAYYVTAQVQAAYDAFDCSTTPAATAAANAAMVACAKDGSSKFILGPVELDGTHLGNVTPSTTKNNTKVVYLTLDGAGTAMFAAISTRLASQVAPTNRLAIILNGAVVTAPAVNGPIPGGQLEITTGQSASDSPATLAVNLGYGHGDMVWKATPATS